MTLSQRITQEKIACAKFLLEKGDLTMTEISERLCFSSPQYFSNKFMQETGCSPSRYPGRTKGT